MANRLKAIDDLGFPDPPQAQEAATPLHAVNQPNPVETAATNILLTALKALSQRTIVALGNLFVMVAAISAFWLWYVTLPTPNIPQLIGLALYGAFTLALCHLVLRRR